MSDDVWTLDDLRSLEQLLEKLGADGCNLLYRLTLKLRTRLGEPTGLALVQAAAATTADRLRDAEPIPYELTAAGKEVTS